MRKLIFPFVIIVCGFLFITLSCKNKETIKDALAFGESNGSNDFKSIAETTFDSTLVATFFENYPKLKSFKPDVIALYKKQQYHYIWFDQKGINEVGNLLYDKISNLDQEGIQTTIPYKNKLDELFQDSSEEQKPNVESELLISSLYFFYAEKVFKGLDPKKSEELGWYLPRKKQSYVSYLDSIIINPSLINKDEKEVLGQYYRLREVLKKKADGIL